MVGVPRSKGCLTCIQRRVKCDEARPHCQRCQTRGTPCLGYTRDRKFCFYSKPENDVAAPSHAVIEGAVVPTLTAKALARQQREGFCAFLDSKFPGQYYGYSTRVSQNWFDVARNYEDSAGKAFDWSMRSIGALYIGRARGDPQLVITSMEMYGRALHQLFRSLNHPTLATADNTLGAAILLGGYEMFSMSGQKSWMLHSRGISHLYQLRGARAHTNGLGRTLLSSFRGFVVFEALARGEPCCFEGEDWKSIIPDTIREERQRGKSTGLGEMIEYAFHEVARCPGFLARTRALVASACPRETDRCELIDSISGCQESLREYQAKLYTGMSSQSAQKESNDFVGPIPFDTADRLGRYSLQGIISAVALLQQLLVLLESDRARRDARSIGTGSDSQDPWRVLDPSSVAGTGHAGPAGPEREAEAETWFDRVSMAMGMLEERPPFPM
ncbi:hypothetical protein N7492_001015 [Penicillium capsulatum]|uniref:Zn(2)-C6 fungal-type domain-containing protein n=1 Tax=Penicillium capsulatum TaxID=69766 RepID=A0A9W9LZY5_9EURO|nr:hypothetical protein N7492_001015 [Penicillium capsulatum]KAJ6129925.1 hypothetical protein N7512_002705 [Penicillium capsulatum]